MAESHLTMKVTVEERTAILDMRQRAAITRDMLEARESLLLMALEFESWMQKNQRGPSFSAFLNEHGADIHKIKDYTCFRNVSGVAVYDAIMEIINKSRECVRGLYRPQLE